MRAWVIVVAVSAVVYGASTGIAVERAQPDAAALKEAKRLKAELAEQNRRLAILQERLKVLDDAPQLKEAERLGIREAVLQSGLPEGHQRRMALTILREAKRHRLNPLLVVAVIRCESSFNSYAVSSTGAMGLMQVMPDTGVYLANKSGMKLARPTHLFDSEINIQLGTAYLAELIKRFGSVERALVAYNAGPTLARKILAQPDTGTRFIAGYPTKVVREMQKLQALQAATQKLSLLDEKPTVLNPG